MPKEQSSAPPGALVELNLDLIDEGKLRKDFDRQLRRAFRQLKEYERDTEQTGAVVVTASVKIFRSAGAKDHYNIEHSVKANVPTKKNVSIVKARADRLLCQPIGSSQFEPEQQAFFDASGKIIAGVDPETGETAPQPGDVAGRITAAH